MQIAYYLNKVGMAIYTSGVKTVALGARLSGIYLLGQYLAYPFYEVGSNLIGAGVNTIQAANAFDAFANQIGSSNLNVNVLNTLIAYAGQIINFITSPLAYISYWVRQVFWWIDYIYTNTYEFIFVHVIRLLDTYFPQWRDLGGWVQRYISEWVQDWLTFRYDPVRWVMDRLRSYSYNVSRFLSDPDGYLRERMNVFFPDLQAFLFNPADYIINKLADRLEIFVDRNMARIIKIAENIISAIF